MRIGSAGTWPLERESGPLDEALFVTMFRR